MNTNDVLTLILAAYGAIVSTILGIRELQRDKRRITVILEYMAFYEHAQITITNVGQRPITITEVGMETGTKKNGKTYWESVPRNALFTLAVEEQPLPVTLGDGEHIALPLSDVISRIFLEDKTLMKASVYDVEGNVYKKLRTRLYDPKWGHYSKMGK